MNVIEQIESDQIAKLSAGRTIPDFQPGDTVIVNVKVKEGERTRVQAYEGVCIARSGGGLQESFTVRKISYGEGVERVFPVYSPMIELDQGRAQRQGPPRQALLSARSPRQIGSYRRKDGKRRREGRTRGGQGRRQSRQSKAPGRRGIKPARTASGSSARQRCIQQPAMAERVLEGGIARSPEGIHRLGLGLGAARRSHGRKWRRLPPPSRIPG